MARRPRLKFNGASYHVMSRGNRKGRIFRDDRDRLHFLEILNLARTRYHAQWRAYVEMKTHYHLELMTPLGNLSQVMKCVNGEFSQAWNVRHRTTGHVFGGPFTSVLIEDDVYARNVFRYIALNPVAGGYVTRPEDWPWSSYAATVGLAEPPEFLDLEWLQSYFRGSTLSEAQRRYREFVEGSSIGLDDDVDQIVVGARDFQSRIRQMIGNTMSKIIVPRSYRALARPSLGQLFAGISDDLELRNQMIIRAQVVYGYTQADIARSLAIHPNTVSKITRRIRRQRYYMVRVR